MSSPSIPQPPNPQQTAAAQTQSNVNTALATGQLNNTNQVTPYGNLTYTSAPGTTVSDGNGGTINVPQYTATTTLSPDQQKLFDLDQATKANVGQIGLDASSRVGDLLSTPVDLSPGAVSQKLMDLGLARLQPQLDRDWQARESDLLNRGVDIGSEQYKNQQDAFQRSQNDAYNQLVLNGYGQEVQTMLAQRNQPINEISALLSQSQVSQPNFVGTPQSQVAPTNVAGIVNDAYQGQLQAANMQNQYNQALMGGLFGLASAPLGGFGYGLGKRFG